MYRKNNTVYIIVALILTLLLSAISAYAAAEASKSPNVSAKSAALYQPDSNTFLFRKNSDTKMPMASTTKIMTALVAIEGCEDLDTPLPVSDECIGTEGSSAYLRSGDKVTMRELLYALMLQSANDAAVEIALRVGGDVPCFADMMNGRAEEIGLTKTNFKNPHGLDDAEHYTTAEELAKIAAEALKNDLFLEICSTYKKSITTNERRRTYVNHNKLLLRYDGALGVKTGYTKKCGRCLVGCAERDGLRCITVTLDAPDDWNDHEKMLDFGFSQMEMLTLASPYEYSYEISTLNGEKIKVANTDSLSFPVYRGSYSLKSHVELKPYLTSAVKANEQVGRVIFKIDGKTVGELAILALEESGDPKQRKGIKLFNFFRKAKD